MTWAITAICLAFAAGVLMCGGSKAARRPAAQWNVPIVRTLSMLFCYGFAITCFIIGLCCLFAI